MYPARESDLRVLFKPIEGCGEGGCHVRIWLPTGEAAAQSDIDVVLMYHGGAFGAGTDSDVPVAEVDYLLAKGVVVVSAQYRLAPHVRFPEIIDDLCDAYAWTWKSLAGHIPGAERVRAVALEGWSAGAASCCLVAANCVSRGLPRPSAMYVHYGWFDFNAPTTAQTVPPAPYDMDELLREPVCTGIAHAKMGENPLSNRLLWLQDTMLKRRLAQCLYPEGTTSPVPPTYDPIQRVSPDFPPTFVLIATKDDLIPAQQSYDFVEALKRNGIEYETSEADMVHGRSEITPLEERGQYEVWFKNAIRPGLDWVIERIRRQPAP